MRRPLLLSLPPNVRSLLHHQARRPFSASAARNLSLVDIAVAGPNAFLSGIHGLGVPWWAAIPLTAILVRSTVIYYLSVLPDRRRIASRMQLVPLINARARVMAVEKAQREHDEFRAAQITAWGVIHRMQIAARLSKAFGVPYFRPARLLNFGVLIVFAETVRLKCGTTTGLLSSILTPLHWLASKVAPEMFPTSQGPASEDPTELLADKYEAFAAQRVASSTASVGDVEDNIGARDLSAADLSQYLKSTSENGANTSSPYFDPSLHTEGMSWCPDLTLVDPTWTLPGTLFLIMAASILLRPEFGTPRRPPSTKGRFNQILEGQQEAGQNIAPRPVWLNPFRSQGSTMRQIGITFAGLFFAAATQMPVAVLLYIIPSLFTGWLQSRWLDVRHPLPPPIRPCARPMRMKLSREWVN